MLFLFTVEEKTTNHQNRVNFARNKAKTNSFSRISRSIPEKISKQSQNNEIAPFTATPNQLKFSGLFRNNPQNSVFTIKSTRLRIFLFS